jgi:hypothetical protein
LVSPRRVVPVAERSVSLVRRVCLECRDIGPLSRQLVGAQSQVG